jgi:peptidoglycan/xylan/chitin deacetylase (PgdA/CDA1 family)
MTPPATPILMYHSIAEGEGPIRISPRVFREQITILADSGRYTVSLREYASWLNGTVQLRPGFVVITFDDGYRDFADQAYPELERRGWGSTVFVPAGKIGMSNDWDRAGRSMTLMDRTCLEGLAREGRVEIGSHAVSHRDLTGIPFVEAKQEIADSRAMLEDITGAEVGGFAPPYGRTNPQLRTEIGNHYSCAVGTRLACANRSNEIFDLPRIEMWYFRQPHRFRDLLLGRTTWYLPMRRVVRTIGQGAARLFQGSIER